MKSKVYESQYISFIDALNRKRPAMERMVAIVLRSLSNDNLPTNAKNEIDEVVQVLQFHFNGEEALMLTNIEHKRIFLVLMNDKSRALTLLEKAIDKEFGEGRIEFELSAPLSKGLDKICALMLECISEEDTASRISVRRYARATNTYAVLSADKDIQNRLTRILQSSGNVIIFKTVDSMMEDYNKYAPEVLFIHDEGIKETESKHKIQNLLKKRDPLSYSVIISNKPDTNFVIECKKIGIKGLILWPTSYQAIFARLSKIPGLKIKQYAVR